MSSLR